MGTIKVRPTEKLLMSLESIQEYFEMFDMPNNGRTVEEAILLIKRLSKKVAKND